MTTVVQPDAALVERLASHRALEGVPRAELEWLAAHGTVRRAARGSRMFQTGEPIDEMFVALRGSVEFVSDKGGIKRRVIAWGGGDIAGVLPFSRLRNSPGNAHVDEELEYLAVHRDQFPEMIRACPGVTAVGVHVMLDRARLFTRSDLHDEKMASLGKLSAGLAHELNNPASAATRSASHLGDALAAAEDASMGLAALDPAQLALVREARAAALGGTPVQRSALDAADREEEIADWLADHGADDDLVHDLARGALDVAMLDRLADAIDGEALNAALRWLAATCAVRALSAEIERATSRIHDLVSAVKRFTYMDRATAPEPLDVGQGLRDTVAVLAAKARARSVTVAVELPDDLPMALGYGGELNQVWSNFVDNAIDAVPDGGRVTVSAVADARTVQVRVTDDGPGIPEELRERIFEPFFTTKPIGHGTGLGLDIARRILQRNEAELAVESRPGHTQFRVTLPRAAGDAPAA